MVGTGSELRGKELGRVQEVDNPQGISWLSFGSLALQSSESSEPLGVVPVGTSDLQRVKGVGVEADDYFWVEINVAATSQADVDPRGFKWIPPLSEEEMAAFDSGQ